MQHLILNDFFELVLCTRFAVELPSQLAVSCFSTPITAVLSWTYNGKEANYLYNIAPPPKLC
jgi:hypothetical protein